MREALNKGVRHELQKENRMNYQKLSMIAIAGICMLCLPVPVSASGDVNIQNFFSGPVLVTTGTQFTVCATNVAGGPNRPNGTVKILIGLLSADESRILFVREAALNPPGQGSTGACLSVSATEMLPGGGQNLPGPLNVVAFAGNGLSGAQQGFLIEASGGAAGGGHLTASLQIGGGNGGHVPYNA